MRDLLAEAWKRQHHTGRDQSPTSSRPRHVPRSRVVLVLVLLATGATLGAFPFVFGWSGKQPQKLSHEQIMRVVRLPDRTSNQVGGLIGILAHRAGRGIAAIRERGKKDRQWAAAADAALWRIEKALDTGVPDRSRARRYPAWLMFADALDALSGKSPRTDDLADCIEVVVYNIEETIVLMATTRNGPPEISERVKGAYVQLRRALASR